MSRRPHYDAHLDVQALGLDHGGYVARRLRRADDTDASYRRRLLALAASFDRAGRPCPARLSVDIAALAEERREAA